jgi:hypothetical protein
VTWRAALVAGAILVVGWAATFLVPPWSDTSITDLPARQDKAQLLVSGALPYRDLPFEYPLLTAPVLALPALAGPTDEAYELGMAAMTLLLTAIVAWQSGRLAERTGGGALPAMAVVAACPFLLGAIVRTQFDMAPVALLLAGALLVLADRPGTGLAAVGAGAMTKVFPLASAPAALAWLLARGRRTEALRGVLALVAIVALVAGAAAALSAEGLVAGARYQLDRPAQVESAQADVVLALSALTGEPIGRSTSHGSVAIVSPVSRPVGVAFAAAFLALLVMFAMGAARAAAATWPARGLVLAMLGSVAAFAALGRVISPQFLLWIVPLLALAVAWRERALAVAAAASCLLTLAEFPSRYRDLVAGEPFAIGLTALRNLALLATVALALGALRRYAASPRPAFAGAVTRPAPSR